MENQFAVAKLKCMAFAFVAILAASWAEAADVHVVSSGGFAAAYKALSSGFEKKTGNKLISEWGPSMGETSQAIPNRLARGEQFDVVIMVGESLDALIKAGKVSEKDHALLALSRIGLAVRAGAAKPDISSVDALKRTLLAARSIANSDSASGVYLSTVLFKRLGIEAQIKDKAHMIAAEPVGNVVARGEAEIGFQQLSELKPLTGIDIVGPIPEEAQQVTPFSAGIVIGAKHAKAARELLDYLASPEAQEIIKGTGLDPAGGGRSR